jgi:hypothetical protein
MAGRASGGGKKGGRARFVYGPVPSRRLGYSLGVDILPYKTCTLDCVYCQLGSAGRTVGRRRAYFSVPAVLAQVREALASGRRIDVITFSGSGEPTLNKNLGALIRGIKKMTRVPVSRERTSGAISGPPTSSSPPWTPPPSPCSVPSTGLIPRSGRPGSSAVSPSSARSSKARSGLRS